MLRKIILDTETTGINKSGIYYINHKIIEIGAIEIKDNKISNNKFHKYIKPNRLIDQEAYNIHGINNKFLENKPIFSDIVEEFIEFIKDSELIIHNAKFDVDFINYELNCINHYIKNIKNICKITDTLELARNIFPGKKNNLDSLCKRYNIENNRKLHGALLDAKLLAKVYLLLINVQMQIPFNIKYNINNINKYDNINSINDNIKVLFANKSELKNNKNFFNFINIKYKS